MKKVAVTVLMVFVLAVVTGVAAAPIVSCTYGYTPVWLDASKVTVTIASPDGLAGHKVVLSTVVSVQSTDTSLIGMTRTYKWTVPVDVDPTGNMMQFKGLTGYRIPSGASVDGVACTPA